MDDRPRRDGRLGLHRQCRVAPKGRSQRRPRPRAGARRERRLPQQPPAARRRVRGPGDHLRERAGPERAAPGWAGGRPRRADRSSRLCRPRRRRRRSVCRQSWCNPFDTVQPHREPRDALRGRDQPFPAPAAGCWGDAELRYRAFGIGYDSDDSASAAGQGVEATLARRTGPGPLAWQARVAYDRRAGASDEERAFATRSALATVDARYRVAPGWAALLGLGAASLHDESLDQPDRNGPYWSFGLAADPSRQIRLLGRFGSAYGVWQAEDELVWRPRPSFSVTARYRQGLNSPLGLLRERLETAPTRVSADAGGAGRRPAGRCASRASAGPPVVREPGHVPSAPRRARDPDRARPLRWALWPCLSRIGRSTAAPTAVS